MGLTKVTHNVLENRYTAIYAIGTTSSAFNIDFSLLLNNSNNPIKLKGLIPLKNEDNLDLSKWWT